MSKICPLFSGSRGNSIYISHGGMGILIDAGRSAKQLEEVLKANSLNNEDLKAIFVTHEHSDHISAIKVFASRYGIKVYGSKGTMRALMDMKIINGKYPYGVIEENGVDLGVMEVKPFGISHDCSDAVGYIIKISDGTQVGICTDLGYVSREILNILNKCKIIVLESNHDIEMLKNSCYPEYLKRRVLSSRGHLSNDACAKVLPEMVQNGVSRIILAHLSSENNSPELAYNTSVMALESRGLKIKRDFTLAVAPKMNLGECTVLF